MYKDTSIKARGFSYYMAILILGNWAVNDFSPKDVNYQTG
jgi:hypothetical protein